MLSNDGLRSKSMKKGECGKGSACMSAYTAFSIAAVSHVNQVVGTVHSVHDINGAPE